MRLFVLVLAILLLPLRSWLGDAMALEAVQPHRMTMSMAHDMAAMADMHHAAAAPAAPAASGQHDTATAQADCHSTCADCQLCHSVAMAAWPNAAVLGEAPHQAPVFHALAFASAAPAPGFKPPIS